MLAKVSFDGVLGDAKAPHDLLVALPAGDMSQDFNFAPGHRITDPATQPEQSGANPAIGTRSCRPGSPARAVRSRAIRGASGRVHNRQLCVPRRYSSESKISA